MNLYSTLVEALLAASKESIRTACGITFYKGMETKKITYNELMMDSLSVSGGLDNLNIRKGTYVILQLKDPELFIKAFWGSILLGCIPVPLTVNDEKGFSATNLKNIITNLNNYIIITEGQYEKELKQQLECKNMIYAIKNISYNERSNLPLIPSREDVAYIQFSSGSTANPKGVCLSHNNICSNITSMIERFGGVEDIKKERMMGWLPLTHNMGLIGMHLMPLFAGMEQFLLSPQCLIQYTTYILRQIKVQNITGISCPTFLMRWILAKMKSQELETLDFSTINTICMGAEHINPKLVRDFLTQMKSCGLKENTICCGYGLAESSLLVSLQPRKQGIKTIYIDDREIVLNGQALEGVNVYTINDQEERQENGKIGELVVESESVMKSYLGIDSSDVVKNGKLKTGDIGIVMEEGVVILGRKKDMIIINAKNYYAQDIEMKIEEMLHIPADYFVITSTLDSQSNELVQLYVLKELYIKDPMVCKEIEKAFETYTGSKLSDVFVIESIPKTVSGKKQRYQVQFSKEIIKVSEPETVKHEKPSSDMEIQIAKVWESVLNVPVYDIHTSFFKMGGDSLGVFECVIQLNKINLYISSEYFFSHPTIAELAKKAESKGDSIITEQEVAVGFVDPLPLHYSILHNKHINQWNFSSLLDLNPIPDIETLKNILRYLIMQHDGLRYRFKIEGSNIREYIAEVEESVCIETIRYKDEENLEPVFAKYQETLDITRCPLKMVAFYKEDEDYGKLLVMWHHVLGDAYSIGKFMEDFLDIYRTVVVNKSEYILKKKTTSLKQWSAIVNKFAFDKECIADIDYWKQTCNSDNIIPSDYDWSPKDNIMIYEKIHEFLLCRVDDLKDAKELQYKLLAAWSETIRKWTQQDEINLSYTLNGRRGIQADSDYDLSRTIGWIAFNVPVKISLKGKNTSFEIIHQVITAVQSIPHGGISFVCLKYINKDEELSKKELPNITFNYYQVNTNTTLFEDSGYMITKSSQNIGLMEDPQKNRKRILDLVVRRTQDNELYVKIHYCSKIHSQKTIQYLADEFKNQVQIFCNQTQNKGFEPTN
ncbi:AMP-binding protein [Anaerocolumna aminovalerica]|uniref:AMP-binding protein n=1 Tax=Anaerocolumna aminovalerica TaxID=1527 RepID=UPI001C0EDCF4|nr:AMP-binding protein [Anaerocolumna aminovalerica]MBU5330887.1 AMP-binding protein [Anaerocolumna aminovalerica]